MAGNPLEEDHERDHRIRTRAYHLWEADGRPHGREGDYWERARELEGMQSAGETGQLPNPMTTGADPAQTQPVEEAFLQENLGEFPDRFADQGESQPVPKGHAPGHKAKSEPVEPPAPKGAKPRPSAANEAAAKSPKKGKSK